MTTRASAQDDVADGVLLLSFGGPRSPEEVMPFLRRVTAGRGVPDERLATVAEHYYARGGVSPINDANEELIGALGRELGGRGVDLPILWGNRNAEPFVADALAEARRLGLRRLRVVVTSLYPSYSGCRQYRENLAAATPDPGIILELADFAWPSDGFIDAQVAAVQVALSRLAAPTPAQLVFVAHSIPIAMAEAAGPTGGEYVQALQLVAGGVHQRLVAAQPERIAGWDLVYCSRSGPPSQPWLEPDVNDHLADLAASAPDGAVVIVPIGFVSDHMEVVQDLDTEAAATAAELGLPCVRADTVDTDPRFVSVLADRVLGPARRCAAGCCPNLRAPDTPAACGQDPQDIGSRDSGSRDSGSRDSGSQDSGSRDVGGERVAKQGSPS